jgi:site-specific DNA-methyltransferase (adenine-specific)
MNTDTLFSSASGEWGTPTALLAELGLTFDLDLCATPGREKAPLYFAPPTETIGWYTKKTPQGPVRLLDETFQARSLAHMKAHPPIGIDALAHHWRSECMRYRVFTAWMNPPFGHGIGEWIKRAAALGSRASTITVVALVPARTDTKWWHTWIEPVRKGKEPGDIEFLEGRLTFEPGPGVQKSTSAPFPTALVSFEGRS